MSDTVRVDVNKLIERDGKLIDIVNMLMAALQQTGLAKDMKDVKQIINSALPKINDKVNEMMKIKVTDEDL